jgi:hypothetical protein
MNETTKYGLMEVVNTAKMNHKRKHTRRLIDFPRYDAVVEIPDLRSAAILGIVENKYIAMGQHPRKSTVVRGTG